MFRRSLREQNGYKKERIVLIIIRIKTKQKQNHEPSDFKLLSRNQKFLELYINTHTVYTLLEIIQTLANPRRVKVDKVTRWSIKFLKRKKYRTWDWEVRILILALIFYLGKVTICSTA